MTKHNDQLIADQLQTLAAAIPTMDDADLLPTILDSCAILLEQVRLRRKPLDQMDPVERSELTGAYGVISGQVTQFAADARTQLGIDTGTGPDPMEELAAQMARSKQLKADRQAAEAQLETLKNEIAVQQSRQQERLQELKALKDFQAGLERELEACSDAVIADQKQANEARLVSLTDLRAHLKAAKEKAAALEAEMAQLRAEIDAVTERITRVPEENKQLLADFDQKAAHLARLEQAQIDCSPEKQLELEKRITALTPQVEALETATRRLSAHCSQLENAHSDLDQQSQTLQTNLLDNLHASMAELQQLMTAHQDALLEIKRQADTLQEKLIVCRDLRRDYAEWFDGTRTPLEAMLAEMDQAEHQKLRETLDAGQCDQIRKLFAQVSDGLQRLDKIISACADAARVDQRNLERRVVAR